MFVAKKDYGKEYLEPVLSSETHEYHYGRHHVGYVNNLNILAESNPEIKTMTLVEIIKSKDNIDGKIFNNAAQIWNHDFYWKSLSSYKTSIPSHAMIDRINNDFGSMEQFHETYRTGALSLFGSGWSWLVYNKNDNKMQVFNTSNADNPLLHDGLVPLVTIDVWEHAYYIDYKNDRGKYVDTIILNCLNWQFAESNLVQFQ